jgi:O-antigen ligase
VTVYAALSGPMPKLGVIALAALVALALLSPVMRVQVLAMVLASVLAPVLLIIDIWHSPQLAVVHRHPALAAGAAVVLGALLIAFALLLVRGPRWVAVLVTVALPFRVPIQAGGATSNLLVPLYFVVGAGVLAFGIDVVRGRGGETSAPRRDAAPPAAPAGAGPARAGSTGRLMARVAALDRVWVARLLALYVGLYAVQATYSSDFEKALQQMVFFYVPFALMFCLLRRLDWTPRLLRTCLVVVSVLAIAFAIVGFVEYATKTIILNPKLVVQNDLHAYFTVNSVFFDPDIFGRFLALVMITLVGALLYARRRGEQLALTIVLALLWAGLVLTLSRSSLGALLLGLGVLGALRWRPQRALIVAAAVIVVGAVAVAANRTTFGLNQGFNGASSGRAGLISGGLHMFAERPVWGFGSGAFVSQYHAEHQGTAQTLSASHTIAVTVAAEQGLIGELVYIALVLVAALTLIRGARTSAARGAVAAAFIALVLHTNLYADFLEDPLTWTLLGIGMALAGRAGARGAVDSTAPGELQTASG